jgi:uncharacterized membrane protein YbaN (DUF454 family)
MIETKELFYGREVHINGKLGFIKSVRNGIVGVFLPYHNKTIYITTSNFKYEYLR